MKYRMKYRVLAALSAITVLILSGCGQKWESGQHVSPSQLPSAVVKLADNECAAPFSENHPEIVSAITGIENPGNVKVYRLVVKGHFTYEGHTVDRLDMTIYSDGTAGAVVGTGAFDQTFAMDFPHR